MTPPRALFIRTFGCQMNEHDSERIAGLLEADGMEQAPDPESADVVVLNTCCVRENADQRLYGNLGHLKALKDTRPDLQIAVAGCLAQKDRELIRSRAPHVDVVFGTHNVHRAADLLRDARRSGPVLEILDELAEFPSALPARRDLHHAAWVAIQIGCDNTCAFCIVPAVRGREVNRRMGDILAEVEALARDGVTEVSLLGQNVNSYGRDLEAGQWSPRFAELLHEIDAIDGIRRIRFTSPHPKDLRPETIEAMATCEAVCEHLHLPLQSGSDRVLARMHRGYTAERYLGRLEAARTAVPDLAVTTDIIVGFPGESDADFEATLAVVGAARYDAAYTFVYSPRPGTEAADLVDDFLPAGVTRERMDRLVAAVEASALDRHRERVGRVEEVLIEGPSKKNANVLTGRTRQNKIVHFPPPPGADIQPGTYGEARIATAAPHHLTGEWLGATFEPRRRVRIPIPVAAV